MQGYGLILRGLLGCMLLAAALTAGAAEVTARVDRDRLVEGETVTLVLQTEDPQQSLATDFSALAEDFEVLDQRSETQMSIVNGQQTALVRLVVTLEPKRSGTLTIPGLRLEGAETRPIVVRVEPAPELAPGEMPPVFIELSLSPEQGPYYVHAQLSLTVRIFYQQNLTEAAINPPAPQQASVKLLDEVPFQSNRNGTRYRVLERRYAIFPERSGELVIPPMTLSGRLIERPADRLWQPSVRGRRVTVESDPLALDILPRPEGFTGEHWLPARRITLSQQISDTGGLKVGEPVTRTVIVDAVGLEENMLEEPGWPEMPDTRIYPDQPDGISRDDGQWVLGHKEFRYAVVPEKAGELVLPEIRLEWWDTVADAARTAVLPEHRVQVTAPELAVAVNPAAPGLAPGRALDPGLQDRVERWRLAALMLALLWLLTLGWALRTGSGRREPAGPEPSPDEQSLLAELKKACKANDGHAARNLFGRWLRRYGPQEAMGSMVEFASLVDDPSLREAVYRLDGGGFSGREQPGWQGEAFWNLLAAWHGGRGKAGRQHPEQEVSLYARG